MSEKELLEAIRQRVDLQIEKIIERGRQTAANIVRKAEAERESISSAMLENTRHAVRGEESRLVNDARLTVKRNLLQVKHDLVESVMKELEQRLESLPGRKDYTEIMARLLQEAAEGVTGPVTVRCRDKDRPIVEGIASKLGLKATVEKAPLRYGGVELVFGERGQFIRRNTIESRMAKIQSELLKEANHIIFAT